MNTTKVISGATFINSHYLWASLSGIPVQDRIRILMREGGVSFFDEEGVFVKAPSAGITMVGGLPLTWEDSTPSDQLTFAFTPPFSLEDIRKSFFSAAGFSGFYSYLNPKDVAPEELFHKMAGYGHLSSTHVMTISIIVLGVSTAVENEFNCQRDIIHLSRLTEARTQAQTAPSIVVLYPEFLPLYRQVYTHTINSLASFEKEAKLSYSKLDFLESRNLLFSSSKATAFMLTGSMRNFAKLVSALSDTGKEEEFKRALACINDNLHGLLPEIFKPTADFGYVFPAHF
jgi:hypothetical protein